MDITNQATSELCNEGLIAIHFQDDNFANLSEYLNPDNYTERAAKRSIKLFDYLNKHGGYVWAEYFREIRVGKVVPSSFWTINKPKKDGITPFVLKTLKLDAIKRIEPKAAMSLKVARPPYTTITEWKAIKNRVEFLVEGKDLLNEWSSLFDSEQESICAEFLRQSHHLYPNLPVLKHLLLPVGRTMQDIDIYGITTNYEHLFAQVTYKPLKDATKKVHSLQLYKGVKVLFCDFASEEITLQDDIWIIPWQLVEKWLNSDLEYTKQVFKLSTL